MKILKELRKKIEKDWGKQCKSFAIDCCVCQVHLALAVLEQKYDEAIDTEIWKNARPHPKKLRFIRRKKTLSFGKSDCQTI